MIKNENVVIVYSNKKGDLKNDESIFGDGYEEVGTSCPCRMDM